MLTLKDLVERLKHQDEISILEILDISAEDLVERFLDKIEDRFDSLCEDLDDDTEGD